MMLLFLPHKDNLTLKLLNLSRSLPEQSKRINGQWQCAILQHHRSGGGESDQCAVISVIGDQLLRGVIYMCDQLYV